MNEVHNPDRTTDRQAGALPRAQNGSLDRDPNRELAEFLDGCPSQAAPPGPGLADAPQTDLPGPCPAPGVWLDLVNGEVPEAQIDKLLTHASACPACAKHVRMMNAEPSPEEAVQVAQLACASSQWQHQMASKLARTPRKSSQSKAWYLWAGAGLAACLAIAVVLTAWWQRVNTPERLLAEAYTHSRIFDLRMPGAGFAEVTPESHLRGSATGRESSSLLDARARIEHHLDAAPQDPHWLQLEARADLLEEKFDPAIDILDRLLASGPVTSNLLADDAAAYFQRGMATGSENDRATALDYLRRADELAPGDPVVLFNEAVAMEDRGQVMNAVETWNRYLRFERDPRWLDEGRRRLQALTLKLNQLKSHRSRMEQHLATPRAMRALAADSATLAALDEEFSAIHLPRLLDSAFPMPVDRSRGSPCQEDCQAARTLLYALAASLERNHQDPWLTQLLPPASSSPDSRFLQASHALAQAIGADVAGNYLTGQQESSKAVQMFHRLSNAAGEDRSVVELSYALQRSSNMSGSYATVHPLLARNPQFAWIQIQGLLQDTLCDPAPGRSGENNPNYLRAISLAQARKYGFLELRARNLLGAAAVDSGDTEDAWRAYIPTVRKFYTGDYPPMRLYGALSALSEVERGTPRVHSALLMQREVVAVLQVSEGKELVPTERLNLATAALRAGSNSEAQQQIRIAREELAANGGGKSVNSYLVETENDMAKLYLEHQDLAAASAMLDASQGHMAGEQNSYHRRDYAEARGQLVLEQGHPELAEPMLREAILEEERLVGKAAANSIVQARQDRDLYALLAGVWLAQGRSSEDALALWERYRLRILGNAVPACPNKGLACLKPELKNALAHLGPDQLLGQVILLDRLLLYRANAQGVVWTSVPISQQELLAAAAPLELAVTSPATSLYSVDQAGRRVGRLLLDPLDASPAENGQLLLEPDPLLGNLPWPSVETAAGPIGLHYDLEESPSLLLVRRAAASAASSAKPLVVGASVASQQSQLLPEVLNEAREVARFGNEPNLLLGAQATQAQVATRLSTATAIHFAGHAAQQDGGTRLLLAPAKSLLSASAAADHPYLDSTLLRKHPPRAARLAVFSACSTGKKEEGWNHGMGDIVDTLASLGVPDVVATRWQIDSESAVPMMDAFYGGLTRGLSVPQALTAARLALSRDPRYRHPYFWAAYYASGQGNSDLRKVFHSSK
ncbi:MAG: CHAT domain-containing tetratricopeptide repeat protein [Terracidiphilus sp.]|nr:CHAT domain-containing tetratricopeptide repeat protein [Terracidiphilus sp.]